MCHSRAPGLTFALIALLGLLSAACAPRAGWRRTAARTCEPSAPARVCLVAEPDRPLTLSLGGAVIIPGECAQAPRGGGLIRVRLADGRAHRSATRSLRARRGYTQRVEADEALRRLKVVERGRCDRRGPAAAREGVSTSAAGC